ncbi:MAG: hypothetical protein GYA17_05860 [Chloroflexi bacterium]|jgi:hypothetical protein|nr:hypothetical protein [Chloroflexota bacterium]
MKTGMLWFDNDPKTDLVTKVGLAADYFHKKYGQSPNLCIVHPSMLPEAPVHPTEIEIRSNQSILPHHLWLGVQEKPERLPAT